MVNALHSNELVWEEVIRLYGMMCDSEGWNDKDVLEVNSIHDQATAVSLKITLSAC